MFLRKAYNYDRDLASKTSGLVTGSDTPTIQSAKLECDINEIVRRFGIGVVVPNGTLPPVYYQDFTEVGDFRSAMDAVVSAKDRFMQLPSATRARFGNDPQAFMMYCEERNANGERANLDEMRKWGLAVPKPPELPPVAPVRVEVVNPAAPKA